MTTLILGLGWMELPLRFHQELWERVGTQYTNYYHTLELEWPLVNGYSDTKINVSNVSLCLKSPS